MVPPWASTMALQMARPTPLDPLPSPRRKGSKIRSRSKRATPIPSSATVISTIPSRSAAATLMVERGGEWRAAFSSRLVTTWSSWL
jgi:hypothetical protein